MASLATSLVGPRTSWLVTSRLLLLHGPARHAHGDAKAERLDEHQTCRYTLVSHAASQSGIARMLVSTDPEQKFA